MTARRPHVSDHALLRYLARVVGVDVDGYRHEIERKVALGVDMGASAVVSEGFRYVLKDRCVATVKPVLHEPLKMPEDRGRRAQQ